MATFSVNWSAPVSPLAGTVLAGQVLIPDGNGLYVVATTANRALYGRADGIAMTAGDASNPCALIEAGPIENTLTGLGVGLASWVRVSALGVCERITTPVVGNDVIGWCETTGRLHSVFGTLTAAIVNGGSAFTPPTGTGVVTVTGGTLDAAATTFPLAANKVTQATGTGLVGVTAGVLNAAATTLPLSAASVVQATGTGIPHVVAGVLTAASSLIVNADVSASAAIALSKVVNPTGTGLVKASGGVFAAAAATLVDADVSASAAIAVSKLAAGTNTYVLTTTGGIAVWAAPASGSLGTNVTSGTEYIGIATGGGVIATAGNLRTPTGGGSWRFRDAANTLDLYALQAIGDAIYIGIDSTFTAPSVSGINLYASGAGAVALGLGGTTYQYIYNGNIESWVPVTGSATGSSPWGAVDGQVQVAVAGSNITLTASQYCTKIQKFTGAPAGVRTITYPLPADDAHSYVKIVWAATTVSGVTASVGVGTTVTVAVGTAGVLLFTPAGVVRTT